MEGSGVKKTVLRMTAFLLGLFVLLVGSLKYKTGYAKTEILTSAPENGGYRLTVYMIGEPDFPFGATHCRFDLKEGKKTITKYRFDLHDDGRNASEENFEITWEEDAVRIRAAASEQEPRVYRLFFDGREELTETFAHIEAPTETEMSAQTESSGETEISAEIASGKTDTVGGTETMEEKTEKIICSCCGYIVSPPQKFCPECGASLARTDSPASPVTGTSDTDQNANKGTNAGMNTGFGMGANFGMFMGMGSKPPVQENRDAEPVNIYPDDSGLRLMVDCYDTAGPLAGGFVQSSEVVLYYDEKTDGYQVHTYASNGYGSGKHEGYYTTKEHAARVMQSIDADAVLGQKEMPEPAGGSRILKFRNEKDAMIRVQCSTGVLSEIKSSVEGLLSEAVRPENRIIPEEAKKWKSCVVFSTGMSMENCFQYEIERMENGTAGVRGYCFVRGNRLEHANPIELSEKEMSELEKIPLGLMLSDIVTDPNPMMLSGFAGFVQDGDSLSVSVAYADGKRDRKIPDREMIRALDELMKQVF